MRFKDNGEFASNYEPNCFGGPVEDHNYAEPSLRISGDADWYDQERGVDAVIYGHGIFIAACHRKNKNGLLLQLPEV